METLRSYAIFLMLLLLSACSQKRDEAAISGKSKAYEETYNKGDAKALSLFWAEDAEYITPGTGEIIKGRPAIERVFTEVFKNHKNPKLTLKTKSITFPSNSEAEEIGTASVIVDGNVRKTTNYKAFYIQKDGDWLLNKVEEVAASNIETPPHTFTPPTQYEHLKVLEWLVGNWESAGPESAFTSNWTWDKNKNFLIQKFEVQVSGKSEFDGKQLVTWDPIKKEIRSWIFDSDGGFGQGVWKSKGKRWIVETSQTLADGKRASSIMVYTPVDQNSYRWKSVGREVGGQLLPNIEPITITKRKG